MDTPGIVRSLEPWLAKHRRPAWKPVVRAGDGLPTASKFSGTPWIAPESPWPKCGECKKLLPLLLQLDLSGLPKDLGSPFGSGLLQLFYCTRENCAGSGGWEPFGDDLSRVRIVHPAGPGSPAAGPKDLEPFPAKQIVDWKRIIDLPKPAEHDELGLRYTYDHKAGTTRLECKELGLDFKEVRDDGLAEAISNSELGDKLGGWPCWIQGMDYPNCPQCGKRMVLIFQLDSEDNLPFMFGDVGCGHITQCPQHKDVVAFGWACG
jgi:uncharacterized protein YwqG